MAFLPALAAAIPSWVGTAVAVGSAVIGGVNASRQAKAASQADTYNALVTKQKADAARSTANAREDQQRREARFMAGQRRAAIAQSGTGLGGSNADIDRQSEIMAELDALNIRYEGATQSTGLLNQSALDTASARNNNKRAKSAMGMGIINGATALLARQG